MKRILLLLTLVAALCLMGGCAKKAADDGLGDRAEGRDGLEDDLSLDGADVAIDSKSQDYKSRRVLRRAKSAIGTPYVRGGSGPGGFDCSGFVCWTYKSVGVNLPRTAREQSVVGEKVQDPAQMKAGDIVAFRHPRRGYHTGIYVGDGKFIHSPRRRSTVSVASMDDPYFSRTFLGARRINVDGNENLIAQAESRLNDYAEEKALRDITRARSGKGKGKKAVLRKGRDGKKGKAGTALAKRKGKDDGRLVADSDAAAKTAGKKGRKKGDALVAAKSPGVGATAKAGAAKKGKGRDAADGAGKGKDAKATAAKKDAPAKKEASKAAKEGTDAKKAKAVAKSPQKGKEKVAAKEKTTAKEKVTASKAKGTKKQKGKDS